MEWTDDIGRVLNNIRVNCILLNKAHKTRYFELSKKLKWYRLPVIILNGCNSIISVGLQPYADQGTISLTTSLIALTCSIIGSIELYLAIQKKLENDLISQRDYYLLGIDIFKTLSLDKDNRPLPAKDYLEKCYNIYTKLIESSDALIKKLDDKLMSVSTVGGNIKNLTSPASPVKGFYSRITKKTALDTMKNAYDDPDMDLISNGSNGSNGSKRSNGSNGSKQISLESIISSETQLTSSRIPIQDLITPSSNSQPPSSSTQDD